MGQWIFPEISGVAPSPRGGLACVSIGSRIVMFGGSDRAPLTFDDLWLLETANHQFEWTRVTPSFFNGCQVKPRSGASLTVVNGKIYLYGGQEPVAEHRFSDIKCLDPEFWQWSDVAAQGTIPPARHSHFAGNLVNQCLLIYGGSGEQGTLSDVWVFNTEQGVWTHSVTSGDPPAAREMHSGCMVDENTMMVFGGRASDGRILCDVAVLDASSMRWTGVEPTPFTRCAHSSVLVHSGLNESAQESSTSAGSSSGRSVMIYGGFSGEAVEGDVLQIDIKTLEIELVRRGPRESDVAGTVPQPRFAHAATAVAWPGSEQQAMIIIGGVNPAEDLIDVAAWVAG